MEVSSCQNENITEHMLMSLKDSSSYLYCVAELDVQQKLTGTGASRQHRTWVWGT